MDLTYTFSADHFYKWLKKAMDNSIFRADHPDLPSYPGETVDARFRRFVVEEIHKDLNIDIAIILLIDGVNELTFKSEEDKLLYEMKYD